MFKLEMNYFQPDN